MAIAKLDFARGQVVNPLGSIGDDLLKFGSSLHQQDKDRLAAERQNELLAMQKAEHQMKVDEQARQLAETEGYKKFSVGLQAPKEMAEASALYNQNSNPVFQKQMDAMMFTPQEQAAYDDAFKLAGGDDKKILEHLGRTQDPLLQSTLAKTQQQQNIGTFGSTMSAMPEFKETEYQKGKKLLAQMGDNAPLAAIKQVREMEAAQIASDLAKSKDLTETAKHAQDSLLKLEIEAMKQGKGIGTITGDNGETYTIGGTGSKAYNPFSFGVKQTEDKVKNYEEGTKILTSRMDALGAGKAEDVKTGQRTMAMDALNKYAAEGYDPADLASVLTTKFQKDPSFYEIWKDKQTGITLTPEELKPLEAKRTAAATLDNMKLQEAQYAAVLAQTRNSGATGTEILKAYGPYYQNQIAQAASEKALLALTPEQRQAQATSSYLGNLLAPKTTSTGDKATKGSSAEEVDVTNLVPKQRENINSTVDRVVDYHKATPVAGYALATMPLLESGFDAKAKGDGGSAQGIYQHRLDRLDALKKFGNNDDVSKIPFQVQTDFAVKELRERPATKDFAREYRKTNPDAAFISQWDELNSKKTAGEAAAYLSEHFEVAKGASKNPNMQEAKKEEAARRGKIADELFAADHDEFGQNKRKVNKAEEEMLKNGLTVNEKQLTSLELAAEGDPYSLDTLNAKAELAALEKNKKSFSAEILAKPMREWSDNDIKQASVLPDIPKDKKNWDLFDRGQALFGNTPMKQDPAKTKALSILANRKEDSSIDATKEEEGLGEASLEVLPVGKLGFAIGKGKGAMEEIYDGVSILSKPTKMSVEASEQILKSRIAEKEAAAATRTANRKAAEEAADKAAKEAAEESAKKADEAAKVSKEAKPKKPSKKEEKAEAQKKADEAKKKETDDAAAKQREEKVQEELTKKGYADELERLSDELTEKLSNGTATEKFKAETLRRIKELNKLVG